MKAVNLSQAAQSSQVLVGNTRSLQRLHFKFGFTDGPPNYFLIKITAVWKLFTH